MEDWLVCVLPKWIGLPITYLISMVIVMACGCLAVNMKPPIHPSQKK